jgi:SagB-type dehydrogenase family enzyme
LDWSNQPRVFKTYDSIEAIPLPKVDKLPETDLWHLYLSKTPKRLENRLDLKQLSQILSISYGLTSKRSYSGQDLFYRSVPSAGALYPAEIYFFAFNIENLQPGLYHYGIKDRLLTPLRRGDDSAIMSAVTYNLETQSLTAVFIISGIFYRSSWKYRDRGYRYVLLDAGHLIENLALALKATGLPYAIDYDFDDEHMGRLIGFDDQKEVSLASVHVGGRSSITQKKLTELSPLSPAIIEASSVSPVETVYEGIIDIHRSGINIPKQFVKDPDISSELGLNPLKWIPISQNKAPDKKLTFAETVFRRRSRRNFINQKLKKTTFTQLIDIVFAARAENFLVTKGHANAISIGFLAGNIEELAPGFYLTDTVNKTAGYVNFEPTTDKMAAICLNQQWLCSASVHFLFMSNLNTIDRFWGPRGYRYAMMAAGRLGHTLYLGATALGLGCCGIGAFYDNEAKNILGLNPESYLLYLIAVGEVKGM